MAYTMHIGGPGGTVSPLYQQTDVTLVFTIYQSGQSDAAVAAGTATPQDVSGWAFKWTMQDRHPPLDPPFAAYITKTSEISITGTYNASPSVNTQRVNVPILAADLNVSFGVYKHGLRRTDSGHNTEECVGDCSVEIGP